MVQTRRVKINVILGTLHDIQDKSCFEPCVTTAITKHATRLIAEEYPFDIHSVAFGRAVRLHTPYLQIDMYSAEQIEAGIYDEMSKVQPNDDYRLSNADNVREEFWLDKIEASDDRGPVLIICGHLHVAFLAEKAEGRGGRVVERIFFPTGLSDGRRVRVLNPSEQDEQVKKRREAGIAGP
jgi:hypothetical protein